MITPYWPEPQPVDRLGPRPMPTNPGKYHRPNWRIGHAILAIQWQYRRLWIWLIRRGLR